MVVRKMGENIEGEIKEAMASKEADKKDWALALALSYIERLKEEINNFHQGELYESTKPENNE